MKVFLRRVLGVAIMVGAGPFLIEGGLTRSYQDILTNSNSI